MGAEPDRVYSIIVVIGVNVCHWSRDFPEDIRETSTSLALHGAANISRSRLVAGILREFEELYLDFVKKRSTAKFLNIWRSFSATLGFDIIINQGDKIWEARALDVLDDGRLLVEMPGGLRKAISSGEISIRKKT